MVHVDPIKHQCFHNSLHAATEKITKGISSSRAYSYDFQYKTLSNFCGVVALDPLLVSYQDPVTIHNVFVQQYHTQ